MKKWNLLLLMLGLFAVSAFAAPTVTFVDLGYYGTYNGFPDHVNYAAGELKFTASGIAGVDDGQFVSFCVEASEHINYGGIYDAILNTGAIRGGLDGGNPDPLSNSTAWLYNKYLDTVLGSSNATLARNYQMAIWYLEQEIPVAQWDDLSTAAKDLVNDAKNNHSTWDNTTIFVLNLYGQGTYGTANPAYKQDCLVRVEQGTPPIVPVPGAILLGGIGVSLVGWLRRRRAL